MKVSIPKSTIAEIEGQALQALAKEYLEKYLTDEFNKIKQSMIEEFMQHPVTQEILNGSSSENISGTLSGVDGNLFSFIGFDATDNPITDILNILEQTSVQFLYQNRKVFVMKINVPTAKLIFSKTPMPWANGRSWAKGIESGISGLGYYIQKFNQGRSLGGVQSQKKISSGKFNNVPYISSLINRYTKQFSSINYSNIRISKL